MKKCMETDSVITVEKLLISGSITIAWAIR